MTKDTVADSFYKKLLIDGKNDLMQKLAGLASKDRTPSEAKRYAAEAQDILRNLAELEEKLANDDGPAGLDYRDDIEINVPIVKFLTRLGRPTSEDEIKKDLIRGQFRGYKDERHLSIRVGRCIRAYTLGRASENPKLKVKRGLVGLYEWPDKMFQS